MKKLLRMLTALWTALAILCGTGVSVLADGEEEYSLPREEGTRQLTFYWFRDGGNYDDCDMWI